MQDIKNIINEIQNLPTLPQVVGRISSAIDDPKTSAQYLASIIISDAPLSTKVLKLVNSAYYGFQRKITTITQATVLLGFNSIKNVILTTSVFDFFNHSNTYSHQFNAVKFWEHSLGTAIACKVLSKRLFFGKPEEAYLAGLLHDIGKMVINDSVY